MKKKHSVAKKSSINNEFMWIDKYKPMSEEEMIGNNKLIKSLKNWLDPKKKKSKKSLFLPCTLSLKITILIYLKCIYWLYLR